MTPASVTPQDKVKELFLTELQKMITLLNCFYISALVNSKQIPIGFCGKVEKAFRNPVLGGLYELLLWLAPQTKEKSLEKLSLYLLEDEKKGRGWIGTFIQLRNRYQHPKEETPEEILGRASQLLPDIFKFDYFGNFMMEDKVYWDSEGDKMCLYPFVLNELGEMLYLKEIKSHLEFDYYGELEAPTQEIKNLWHKIRILDDGLINPTPEEIKIKGRRKFTPAVKEDYWWFEKISEKNSIAYIIEKDLSEKVLSHIHSKDSESIPIIINLKEKNIMEEICNQVGIEPVNKIKDFVETFKNNNLSIAVKTDDLKSKEFIQLIDWMRDAISNLQGGKIKILVEREIETVKNEQDKIYDHISDIDNIFEKPPHTKGNDITSFIWSRELKKKTFGIF